MFCTWKLPLTTHPHLYPTTTTPSPPPPPLFPCFYSPPPPPSPHYISSATFGPFPLPPSLSGRFNWRVLDLRQQNLEQSNIWGRCLLLVEVKTSGFREGNFAICRGVLAKHSPNFPLHYQEIQYHKRAKTAAAPRLTTLGRGGVGGGGGVTRWARRIYIFKWPMFITLCSFHCQWLTLPLLKDSIVMICMYAEFCV